MKTYQHWIEVKQELETFLNASRQPNYEGKEKVTKHHVETAIQAYLSLFNDYTELREHKYKLAQEVQVNRLKDGLNDVTGYPV